MKKDKQYIFVKYTDTGVITKRYCTSKSIADFKPIFEKVMGTEFDPETCYVKPVIRKEYKDYNEEKVAQVVFDAACNLMQDIKNKYAVADDLLELSKILEGRTAFKKKKEESMFAECQLSTIQDA